MKKKISAFALLEVSLALLVLGLLLGGALPLLEHISTLNARLKAERSIQQALQALGQYVRQHGFLPCPLTAQGHKQRECPGHASGLFPWEEVLLQPSLPLAYSMIGDLSAAELQVSHAQRKADACALGEPFSPLSAFCSAHSEGLREAQTERGENDFIAFTLSTPGSDPIWISRNNLVALYAGSYC